jgi:hypothetical protein
LENAFLAKVLANFSHTFFYAFLSGNFCGNYPIRGLIKLLFLLAGEKVTKKGEQYE